MRECSNKMAIILNRNLLLKYPLVFTVVKGGALTNNSVEQGKCSTQGEKASVLSTGHSGLINRNGLEDSELPYSMVNPLKLWEN